ncbi:nicotinamide riboside transporter PnuC [Hymenobacter koreensis]|uniref:Nicotinamide riboside transporter PnuC n=1 Tax=Hymenobacter koreensis TaxID=1084523 RepID=A0ABP8IW46_9BACT
MWLAARESVWNFPVAIVACVIAGIVYFQAKLYSDMGLQVVFVALAFYGWWMWLRKGPAQGQLHVSTTSWRWWVVLAALAVGFTLIAGYLFETYTDAAAPYWDNGATAVSLVAQFLLTRKKLENWLLWIAVDILYVVLYWHRGLALFSVEYVIFIGLAVYGYWEWRRLRRAAPALSTPLSAA